MDKLYYLIGFIVTWGLIVVLLCSVVYILVVALKILKLWLNAKNWYNFHVQSHVISTDILRDKYNTCWVMAVPGNGYWILMYRLRNIKRLNKKENLCENCGSTDIYVRPHFSNHDDFYNGFLVCNTCGAYVDQ